MKNIILPILTLLFYFDLQSQDIYKTPSGSKYHLESCRMVENVSKKIVDKSEISKSKLKPCKICKPPAVSYLRSSNSSSNKAVGTSKSVQCIGLTKKGKRCKHKTSLANGYCYQHTSQNSKSSSKSSQSPYVSRCGARTKSGRGCKRKVKGGGRCYQHGG